MKSSRSLLLLLIFLILILVSYLVANAKESKTAGCYYKLNTAGISVPASGGWAGISVKTSDSRCVWSAFPEDEWIGGGIGEAAGNFTAPFFFEKNPGAPRAGHLTVAGQVVVVWQAGQ